MCSRLQLAKVISYANDLFKSTQYMLNTVSSKTNTETTLNQTASLIRFV